MTSSTIQRYFPTTAMYILTKGCKSEDTYVKFADHEASLREMREALEAALHCVTNNVSPTRMKKTIKHIRAALEATK